MGGYAVVAASKAARLRTAFALVNLRARDERCTRASRRRRLRLADLARVASVGLRTRRMRAALSALGIAIGVAAIVAVLGLSSSSQAGLLAEIDRLGTNLLTVQNGQTFRATPQSCRSPRPRMISRIGPVSRSQYTGSRARPSTAARYPPHQHERALGAGGQPRPPRRSAPPSPRAAT